MSNKRIKLSFEEEDEEVETSFHVAKATKKAPAAKSKRPIMQAPITVELEQPAEVVLVAAASVSTSSYSKESLAALHQAQNFATSVTKDLDVLNAAVPSEQEEIMMELSGDQAEALEAAMELQEQQQQLHSHTSANKTAYDTDQAALLSAKQHTQQLLKKRKHDDNRLFINPITTTNNTSKAHLADLDPSFDNDLTWEDEIIQRGSIHRITNNNIMPRNPNIPDYPESDLDTQDLTQIAQTAVVQSQAKLEELSRRLSALAQDMMVSKSRVLECDEKLEVSLTRLKTTELAKKFWPDFVGMLREKSPYIFELHTAFLTHSKLTMTNNTKARLCEMEKRILQVKENGLLIGIGDYQMQLTQPLEESQKEAQKVDFSDLHTAAVTLLDDVANELITPTFLTEQILRLKSVVGHQQYEEAHVSLSLCTLFWPLLLLDLITVETVVISNNNKLGEVSKSAWFVAAREVDNEENIIVKYLLQHTMDEFYLPLLASKLDFHSSSSSSSLSSTARANGRDFEGFDNAFPTIQHRKRTQRSATKTASCRLYNLATTNRNRDMLCHL